eukprot:m.250349 g.250349  ORF g.250349 m.250349 type:complete len:181 (-) comp15884_c0_seq4:200-742(-)
MAQTKTVLLIGSTGNGKSTLGNVIAGEAVFRESALPQSETRQAQVHVTPPIQGERYRVVDTVGIGDTDLSREQVGMLIADACHQCRDGLVQVLFVTKGRLTATEIDAFDLMTNVLLGDGVVAKTTIVYTHFAGFRDPAQVTAVRQSMEDIVAAQHISVWCSLSSWLNVGLNTAVAGLATR